VTELNEFSYFTEIEETFIRLREKSFLIGPLDWALIESWKERGIPLRIVERSIENVFEAHKSKVRRRAINSLRYCQSEVEAQYSEWLETQVGRNDFGEPSKDGTPNNPFAKDAVAAHLESAEGKLSLVVLECAAQRSESPAMEALGNKLGYAIGLIRAARAEFEETPDPRKLEEGLTTIETLIDTAIMDATGPKEIAKAREAVEEAMAPYARQMPAESYNQTFDTLLTKRLREMFGVPRLSLFHMKN